MAPEHTASPLLQVRNLAVNYTANGTSHTPVNGVSFHIDEREVVGLIGDAGSGKSTAALALLGLTRAPGKIVSGQVILREENLLALSEHRLREIRGNDIGIIVQNPRKALNPMLQIGTQIELAYRAHHPGSRRSLQGKAVDMLNLVGINDPEQRRLSYAHELSGGMAQRALIAMALSSQPGLLIADEPTSGLDVTIQAQFLDEMWSTVQKTGSAMLLITQELGIIANYCDRVLVLHDGAIVEDAPVGEYFTHPQHRYSQSILRLLNDTEQGNNSQLKDPTNKRTPGESTSTAAESSVLVAAESTGNPLTSSANAIPAAAHSTSPLIKVDSLTKHFPLRNSTRFVQAVQGASFVVERGQTLGLVGESGSGKTTVGRCLVRLLDPTAGAIRYDDVDLASLSHRSMRRYRSRIQIVLQDPFDSLNPKWTIARSLNEPLSIHTTLSRRERRKRCTELLNRVGLDSTCLQQKPADLGAGDLQRINIARALACNPEFIVLDEPTSNLSPGARVELIELLRDVQAELKVSYLFISHDLTTVRYVCNHVAVMYLGQIVEHGSVEQVFETPRHPYSIALLSAHLFPDPTHRRVDNPVETALVGEIPSPIDLPGGCYLASRCPHAVDACTQTPQVLETIDRARSVRCHRVVNGELPGANA